MKEIFEYSIFPGTIISESILRAALQRWPQFQEGRGIRLRAEVHTKEFFEMVAFLTDHGLPQRTPFVSRREAGLTFPIQGIREISPQEVDDAEFLLWQNTFRLCESADLQGNSPPVLEVLIKKAKQSIGGVFAEFSTICTEATRKKIYAQNFNGLIFRPVSSKAKKPQPETIWQLWSNVTMPPMKNRFIKEDETESPLDAPYHYQVYDPFMPKLFRYNANAISHLRQYDAVMTKEHFGPGTLNHQQRLIVSQRFRRWCDAQKYKVDWYPVILE